MAANISTYFSYYTKKKREIFLSFFLSFVQAFSLIPIAIIIQRIFNNALPNKNSALLMLSLAAMLALFLLNAVVTLWNRHVSLSLVKEITAAMRKELLFRTIALPKQYHADQDSDLIHASIVNDTERIDWMTNALLTQFFPGALITVGLSCFLLYENPLLFLVIAIMVPLLYGMSKLIRRAVKKRIQELHRDFSYFSKGVFFTLKFNELIKISTAEADELERQDVHIQRLKTSSHRMAWLSTAHTVMQNNILLISGIGVLLFGGLEVIHGTTNIGSLIAIYVALNLLTANAGGAIGSIPTIIEGIESLGMIMPMLTKKEIAKGNADSFAGLKKGIAFENVSFGYDDAQFNMRNINFTVKKNEAFGIVGPSGAGKSTIINLLLGFYEPAAGSITFDGKPLADFDPIAYRRRVGVLMQDPLIFSGTIRENLTYGLADIDEKIMEKICTLCNIHDHIQILENGYESEIGDRGVKLSGGQKQRIAIARAVLRNPEILILDEPDNNLDEAMFVDILKNLKQLPMTIIIITHNKNLFQYFDNTYNLHG